MRAVAVVKCGCTSAHNWYFDAGRQTSLRPFSKLASSEVSFYTSMV